MTLHTTLRITSILAIAVLVSSACLAESDPTAATYLEGTLTQIPSATNGSFDLNDKNKLEFDYAGTALVIPYESISYYEWSRPTDGFGETVSHGAAKVSRSVLPMLYKSKYLTISYKDGENKQKAVFAVSKGLAGTIDPVLESWVKHNHAQPVSHAKADDDSSWWGNKYWKTNRNTELWKEAEEAAKPPKKGAVVASRDDE